MWLLSKNKGALAGAVVFCLLVLVAAGAPLISPFDPGDIQPGRRLLPPGGEHVFGTDGFGRDILSRVIFGTRISLAVGGSVVVVTTALGIILGLLAGYYRKLDNILMRVLDGLMAFPAIILQIAIMAALGARLSNVIMALSIVYAPRMARVVRSAVLVQREQQYVEAARAIGASDLRINLLHILPNCIAPVIVQATMIFAYSILAEASLSFLGVGVPPEIPSWGATLNEGRVFMWRAPWVSIFPGLAITLCVLSLNMFGDGLRDILDPKIRKKKN
ncbi:peptide ABC transporter permease [Clostridiales bacterium PH28_bin88]|nr:peptide ABC transporter permease [Clostridiales bacterium PH28_bin88]